MSLTLALYTMIITMNFILLLLKHGWIGCLHCTTISMKFSNTSNINEAPVMLKQIDNSTLTIRFWFRDEIYKSRPGTTTHSHASSLDLWSLGNQIVSMPIDLRFLKMWDSTPQFILRSATCAKVETSPKIWTRMSKRYKKLRRLASQEESKWLNNTECGAQAA